MRKWSLQVAYRSERFRRAFGHSMARGYCTSYSSRRWAGSPSDKEGIAWTGSLVHQSTPDYVISSRKCKRELKMRVNGQPVMIAEHGGGISPIVGSRGFRSQTSDPDFVRFEHHRGVTGLGHGMSRRHPVCGYHMVGDSWICLLTLASFGAVDGQLSPYSRGTTLIIDRWHGGHRS
jgi:hypothetical protein